MGNEHHFRYMCTVLWTLIFPGFSICLMILKIPALVQIYPTCFTPTMWGNWHLLRHNFSLTAASVNLKFFERWFYVCLIIIKINSLCLFKGIVCGIGKPLPPCRLMVNGTRFFWPQTLTPHWFLVLVCSPDIFAFTFLQLLVTSKQRRVGGFFL